MGRYFFEDAGSGENLGVAKGVCMLSKGSRYSYRAQIFWLTAARAGNISWIGSAHGDGVLWFWSGSIMNLQCPYDIEHDWLWQRFSPRLPKSGRSC